MSTESGRLLVCNCNQTMPLESVLSAAMQGNAAPFIHSALCRSQLENFRDAAATGAPLTVCCTQEAPLFREVAQEAGLDEDALSFINIRERAGWSDEAKEAGPKIAALIAEAAVARTPTTQISLAFRRSLSRLWQGSIRSRCGPATLRAARRHIIAERK